MSDLVPKIPSRLLGLDYLRGFFIVVIIIDHLWRWPSLYILITAKAELWVTAAEGFVAISGLLIGYIRGYKNRSLPMSTVTFKIWRRAAILYLWLVIMTLVFTILTWYVKTAGVTAGIAVAKDDWVGLVMGAVTMSHPHQWVFFLAIYFALLVLTPAMVWLLRTNRAYMVVALSFVGYALGRALTIEWLQWMPIFFLPAIAGYYLPQIQAWWTTQTRVERRLMLWLLALAAGGTLVLSIVATFFASSHSLAIMLNESLTKMHYFSFWRIPISLLWFAGLVVLFEYGRWWIGRLFGWLLLPFGTRSLTAYITHGLVLFPIAVFLGPLENIWYNTAIGTFAIIASWALIRLPIVQRVVPQ